MAVLPYSVDVTIDDICQRELMWSEREVFKVNSGIYQNKILAFENPNSYAKGKAPHGIIQSWKVPSRTKWR